MAGFPYTTPSSTASRFSDFDDTQAFNGGLNSTAGSLFVRPNESSDLLNIDFNKFGSILKRNGYTALNTSAIASSPASDGLYWYQFSVSGAITRMPINVAGGKVYSMTAMGGTWDDVTGSETITAGYHCDFETFLGNCYITNGKDAPLYYTGTGNVAKVATFTASSYTFTVSGTMTVLPTTGATYTNNGVTYTVVTSNTGFIVATGSGDPETSGTLTKTGGTGDGSITFSAEVYNANIQSAKYVALYDNYLCWANVKVAGTYYLTRVYWMDLKNPLSASADNWLEVAKDDGQEITGIKVLADRLVIYKTQSIYAMFSTGDIDIPFILPGGGKTNSHVGCIAPWSIQEVDNSHIFMAFDGLYIFDGNSSNKISYKIDYHFLNVLARSQFNKAVSMVYKTKNRYLLGITLNGGSQNAIVIVWDYYNNAFSIYDGWAPSSMQIFLVDGYDERPYFGDYSGFVYRTDIGLNDYPLNTKTKISAYYYTNWKNFYDLVSQKNILTAYIYYIVNEAALTFSYSYDFTGNDTYSFLFSMSGSGALWGTVNWGAFNWAKGGGQIQRVDLDGRGRVVRFKFENNNIDETFQIDGLGTLTSLETME